MPRILNVGELGHYNFLYAPAVLNVVTTGYGTGTTIVLKWNLALGYEVIIQSSVIGAIIVAKNKRIGNRK